MELTILGLQWRHQKLKLGVILVKVEQWIKDPILDVLLKYDHEKPENFEITSI